MSKLGSVQTKTQMLFGLIVIAITAIIFLLLNNKLFGYLDYQIDKRQDFFKNIVENNLDKTIEIYNYKLDNLLNSKHIIDSIEQNDKNQLLKYAQQFFNEGKSDKLTIMTFRDTKGYTLLRVHKQRFFGDSVGEKRRIINAVAKNKRSYSGFEVGKLDALFRIAHPIFNNKGDYIGNVEIGFKPEHFIEPTNTFMDVKLKLLVQKKYTDVMINSSNLREYNDLVLIGSNDILSKEFDINSIDKNQIYTDHEHSHSIYRAATLFSHDKQEIGYLMVEEDINHYIKEYNDLVLKILVFLIIGAGFIFILLRTSFKYYSKSIEKNILIDPLTQLKNQTALINDIDNHKKYILILTDINEFHLINDIYGNKSGNNILIQYAQSLKAFADKYSLEVYRITSDEFIFVDLHSDYNIKKIESLVRKLLNHIDAHIYTLEDGEELFNLDVTAGVSFADIDALEHANQALKSAQKFDKPFEIYQEHLNTKDKSIEMLNIKNTIQYAITKKRVVPFFQPIVNAKGEVVKYESLMRLYDQDEKIYFPDSFIPIAHTLHLYPKLSLSMLDEVAKVFKKNDNITLSFNISFIDIHDNLIVSSIEKLLEELTNTNNKLVIEMVESENVDDFDSLIKFIYNIKQKGAIIAIDDFGSGYSNFSHIFSITPDYIKIDGSLIKNILTDEKNQVLVKGIVEFSKNLNIKVIAEYVENKEIFEYLTSLDIDEYQGYYFSRPKPQSEFGI